MSEKLISGGCVVGIHIDKDDIKNIELWDGCKECLREFKKKKRNENTE